MTTESQDRRSHLRHTVHEPCTVIVEGTEYPASVVNMSVAGAAIRLDVEVDIEPEPDTVIELDIERVGRIRTKVVRRLVGGAAVEFIFEPGRDRSIVATLFRVLNEFAARRRS